MKMKEHEGVLVRVHVMLLPPGVHVQVTQVQVHVQVEVLTKHVM